MSAKRKDKIVSYDGASDVLYLGAKKGFEEEYVEIAPGIHVELDQKGRVIGVEVLQASRVFRPMVRSAAPPRGRAAAPHPRRTGTPQFATQR